ncbi:MAG: cytidine deaminase [Candidatus Microthrix sp.]|uniref:Cytidine deaminase n=1 Tax=Candidatus Neomicrothrix subdominans TaxID=2954438 RepID=A0A936NBI1_9ACTN|nr:cytidine deaminase [Candidatus Microthrix subdominans]
MTPAKPHEHGRSPVSDGAAGSWDRLIAAAVEATERSYAPYSGVRVGAAAETADGRTLVGSNTECASIGLSLCAECAVISDLARTGGGRLQRLVAVGADGVPLPPCGRCRQLIAEFADGLIVMLADGPHPIDDLLPWGFGPADVARLADGTGEDDGRHAATST